MSELSAIFFDLDDTLIETSALYFELIDRFVDRLVPLFPGVPRQSIVALQDSIDARMVEAKGFATDRFPESLVETYRQLAEQQGQKRDPSLERELLAMGQSVFDRPPALVEGARDLLEELAGRFELVLYTLGVPEVQRAKIEHHGLARHFDEVHIVAHKGVETLRKVVNGRKPAQVMVVGDSLRGEIGPALELGCHAVWLRRPRVWSWHKASVEGTYHTIDELRELRRILKASESRSGRLGRLA